MVQSNTHTDGSWSQGVNKGDPTESQGGLVVMEGMIREQEALTEAGK